MKLAPHVPLSGAVVALADGSAGLAQTVATMRYLVDHNKSDPAMVEVASGMIWLVPSRDQHAEAAAILAGVSGAVRYQHDVLGVETIATPQTTLARRAGDCDDQSVLFATLCEAVGYPTRFVVAGYNIPPIPEHVYVQVNLDGEWLDADPTENHGLGWAPPGATYYQIERR